MGKRKKKVLQRHGEKDRTPLLKKIKCINKKSKQFIVGCNAVLRALEQNKLDLVAASREINSVVGMPIGMLCERHNVPLLSLEPRELDDLDFKIKRITAFGIKKDTVDEDADLKKLIQEAGVKPC